MNKRLKMFVLDNYSIPKRALDLGAGELVDVNGLKKMGWEVEGVDLKMGVNLEKFYLSKKRPFDLVYSNFVIHKIKNQTEFVKTAFENLKKDGWFFIQTFDLSDLNSSSKFTGDLLSKLLHKEGFRNIVFRVFDVFDDEEGHNHWHRVLEASAQK